MSSDGERPTQRGKNLITEEILPEIAHALENGRWDDIATLLQSVIHRIVWSYSRYCTIVARHEDWEDTEASVRLEVIRLLRTAHRKEEAPRLYPSMVRLKAKECLLSVIGREGSKKRSDTESIASGEEIDASAGFSGNESGNNPVMLQLARDMIPNLSTSQLRQVAQLRLDYRRPGEIAQIMNISPQRASQLWKQACTELQALCRDI